MKVEDIKEILEKHTDLQEKLYARGFLFTDDAFDLSAYPFYGLWKTLKTGDFSLVTSPCQQAFICEKGGCFGILIGHAYNPFSLARASSFSA